MKREDPHRPGLISPADYDYLFSFSYPGTSGEPGLNLEMLRATRTGEPQKRTRWGVDERGNWKPVGEYTVASPWGRIPYFRKESGTGGCDICGASFRHGDVWRLRTTGEAIVIGHICGGKMGLVTERGEWTRNQREMARLKKEASYIKRRLELAALRRLDAVRFLDSNPGLEEALKLDHYISRDLAAKLSQYGSLSPKQVDLARRLAAEAAAPKVPEQAQVLPPAGRHLLEGRVLSTKNQEGPYGTVTKMLVQVSSVGGEYRLFGTAPSSVLTSFSDNPGPLTGCTVRFTAEVQPKETGFGFFARPTGAARVQVPG